jgi:RNA polymerase sigma factor (sigma-70 family)
MRAPRGDDRAKDGQAVAADLAVDRGRVDAAVEFSRLADRYLDVAYRLAGVILGDPTEAEDAAHDAAVLAWRNFGTLRDQTLFEQWFCRIVVNVCRDRLRRRRRHPVAELPPDESIGLQTADGTGRLVTRDAIDRAFVRLEPDHQIVVALRFYRDLTVDEMARRLGIPTGTVKSRLHHALRRLRDEMERQGWREDEPR